MADAQKDKNIIIYGAMWCPDCRRAKQFLGEHAIPFQWIDTTTEVGAIEKIEELTGRRNIPVLVFPDGDIFIEPSNTELAEKTGIDIRPKYDRHDVIIIGGGPAGLTAAIYAARDGMKTLVLEARSLGGQVAITKSLENFPGFPEGVNGQDFAELLTQQARHFGVDIVQGESVTDIVREGEDIHVKVASERDYIGKGAIIATGTRYKRLQVKGERELVGTQVHFCATCDGAFYKDKDVLVVGGGNSGFEEGLFLAEQFAKSVKIVEFLPEAKASEILQEEVAKRDNMDVVLNHAIKQFKLKEGKLDGVLVEDRATGKIHEWHPDGIFVFVGLKPNTGFLQNGISRDGWGYIKTDDSLMTSMPGVFAIGDVRSGSTKQAVSAAGEGATAAMMIREYIKRETTLLEPV